MCIWGLNSYSTVITICPGTCPVYFTIFVSDLEELERTIIKWDQ